MDKVEMDKTIFIVLAGRHGYTPTLYGIYNDINLAEIRGKEVTNNAWDNYYTINEFPINESIEFEI